MENLVDQWDCCGEIYSEFKKLANHIVRNHSQYILDVKPLHQGKTEDQKGNKNIKCRECFAKVASNGTLIIHVISNHIQHSLKNVETNSDNWSIDTSAKNCRNLQMKPEQKSDQEKNDQKFKRKGPRKYTRIPTDQVEIKIPKCPLCMELHTIHECPTFSRKAAKKRTGLITHLKLCYMCLGQGHTKFQCINKLCIVCSGPHNILLCYKLENFQKNKKVRLQN